MPRHGPLSLKPFLITLLREAYDEKQANLQMTDLRELAAEYSMRIDDIASTLIDLTSEGGWGYQDDNGEPIEIASDLLAGEERLSDCELEKLSGTWRPIATAED